MSSSSVISQYSYLGKKGYTIPKSVLSKKELDSIYNDLWLTPIVECPVSGSPPPVPFAVFKENDKKIYVPRFYGIQHFGIPSRSEIGEHTEPIDIEFTKPLRDYQELVVDKYIKAVNVPTGGGGGGGGGGGILSLYTGAGKTVCAIKIISLLKQKTLIIVHKEFLMNQWMERIREFTPTARLGRIQGTLFDIDNKDIVLAMIQTLYNEEKTFNLDSFGLCIVDEVHRIGSSQFHKAFFKIQTPYWLGISATVKRKDAMDKLIYMFMGDVVHSIERKGDDFVSVRGIDYISNDDEYNEVATNYRGEIAYSTMISKICGYKPRSDFIVRVIKDLITENRNSQLLVLSHTRAMLEYLYEKLTENNVSCGFYVGGMKQCDLDITANTKQVVLSTYMMSSEALDIPTLSTLVLASPKTDIIQCVGRILRKKHETPIIVDIVDSHTTFQNQWNKRKIYYKKCNYKIEKTDIHSYGDNGMAVLSSPLLVGGKPASRSVWKLLFSPIKITDKAGEDGDGNGDGDGDGDGEGDGEKPQKQVKRKCLIQLS